MTAIEVLDGETESAERTKVKTKGRGLYGFVFRDAAGAYAQSKYLATDARLLLACFSRANNVGHARFDPGELAKKLEKASRTTGEIQPLDRTSVDRAIGRAIDAGWAAPVSTSRCVVVAYELWDRSYKGTPWCEIHKSRAPWRGNDWGEPPADDFSGK